MFEKTAALVISVFFISQHLIAAAATLDEENRQYYHAEKAFSEKLYDVAVEEFREFVAGYPDSEKRPRARLMLGQGLYHLKEFDKSIAVLEAAAADPLMDQHYWEVRYWLAECRLKKGQYDSAAELFRQVLDQKTGENLKPQAFYGIGLCYFGKDEYDSAIAAFDQIARDYPDTAHLMPALLQKSRCLLKQKRSGEAKKLLLTLLEQDVEVPYRSESFYLLGEAETYLQNYSEAAVYYGKSMSDTEPRRWYPEAEYGIGWCQLKMKKYDEAVAAFTELGEKYPEGPVVAETLRKTKLSLGKALFLKGDHEQARIILEEYTGQYKDAGIRAEAYFLLGEIYAAAKQNSEAVQAYDLALKMEPEDILRQKLCFQKGQVLYAEGEYQRSLEQFQISASMKSVDQKLSCRATARIGDACLKLDQYERGAESYRKLLEEYPNYEAIDSVIYRLGWCFYKMGDYEKAIATFETLPSKYPQSDLADDALYRIGAIEYRKGQYQQAIDLYKRIEVEYPATDLKDKLRYQLGVAYYNLGFYDMARGSFESVVRDYPASDVLARSAYEIGWCYYQLGQTDQAMKHFQRLVDEDAEFPYAPDIMFWMGEQYYNPGRYDEAQKFFERLAASYPKHNLADSALYWAGRSAYNKDAFDTALKLFSSLREKYSRSDFYIDAGYQIGKIYMERNDFATARETFLELNRRWPDSHRRDQIELEVGRCEIELGNLGEAFKIFSSLVEKAKTEIRARATLGLAECFLRENKPQLAIRKFMSVLWDFPDEREVIDEAVLEAAKIYEKMSNYSRAIKLYRMIVDRDLPSKEEALARIKAIKKRESFFGL